MPTPKLEDLNVHELAELASELLTIAAPAFDWKVLFTTGLMEGFSSPEMAKFLRRLLENDVQKRQLARYQIKKGGLGSFFNKNNPISSQVFLESGSTIAYLIGSIASHTMKTGSAPRFLSNNLLALTALAGIAEVEPIQGTLLMKYCGFMPFRDDFVTDPNVQANENNRYLRLIADARSCEAYYCTCSNFSFLAGPLVGSRSNAITKRALSETFILQPDRKAVFDWMFHFEKIVPTSEYPEIQFQEVTSKCMCSFTQPNPEQRDAVRHSAEFGDFTKTWPSGKAMNPGHKWHLDYLEKHSPDLSPVLQISSAYHLNSSWIHTSKDMRLIIALPTLDASLTDTAFSWLVEEIERVNSVLDSVPDSVSYKLDNRKSAKDDKVAVVSISRR